MSKAVIQPFEEYQKGRIMFVQTVAELANRPKHIDSLKSVDVMKLLGPLLSDPVTSIKQSAALAIGRLARHNKELANNVVDDNGRIIKLLLESFDSNNKFYKKATCFVISSVARHNEKLAETVVKHNAVNFLVKCLEEYDPTVKEAAVWALGYIAKHTEKLAMTVANEPNCIDYLILCLQEPEINIKRITVQTISYIAKHNHELTEKINSKDNLSYILYFLVLKDTTLKYKICNCLADMAKNNSNVASRIIQDLNPKQLIDCIESPDPSVQKSAITLINAIASRDNLSETVNEKISAEHFINFLRNNRGSARTYGIPLISTMVRDKVQIAKKYVVEGGVLEPLNECILKIINRLDRKKDSKGGNSKKEFHDNENQVENEINATLACKAIGDLSKHTHEITNRVSIYNNLPYNLLTLAITRELPNELKQTAMESLIHIIDQGDQLEPINPLLNFTFNPHDMRLPLEGPNYNEILLKLVKKQKEILHGSGNKNDKKYYLESHALKKILKLKKQFPKLEQDIAEFENLFSTDIVNFYDEEFAQKLKENYLNKI